MSFVETVSLFWRVHYRRFYCTCSHCAVEYCTCTTVQAQWYYGNVWWDVYETSHGGDGKSGSVGGCTIVTI